LNGPVSVTVTPPAAAAPADPCGPAEAHWNAANSIGTSAAYEDHLARFPTCAFVSLAKARIDELKQRTALASPADTPANPVARTKDFDGKWDVTVRCTNASGALGYGRALVATVTNGVLHGEDQSNGRPLLALDGEIGADGKATLKAHGFTGDSAYTVNSAKPGTPYGYTVDAKFERTRGTGKRNEARPCDLTFAKR
jgi:hypothetical protein